MGSVYLATGPDAATDRMIQLLVISALLGLASAQQREFKAKFEDCGSILDISPAIQGSVSITAPFNRKTKRHVLFKGASVEICINGTIPSNAALPVVGQGLKNSAHGQLIVLGLEVPLAVPFCDVSLNACAGASPACDQMQPGSEVRLCSSLQVPTQSPDTDVNVTWKVLREETADTNCESTFQLQGLRQKGKTALACLKIPARVQSRKKNGK